MKLIGILNSTRKNKRFLAIFDLDGEFKAVNFGDNRYQSYIDHHDEKRKSNYKARHQHDNLNDPTSPGALSWYLLWNKHTLQDSIVNFKKKFDL